MKEFALIQELQLLLYCLLDQSGDTSSPVSGIRFMPENSLIIVTTGSTVCFGSVTTPFWQCKFLQNGSVNLNLAV